MQPEELPFPGNPHALVALEALLAEGAPGPDHFQ